MFRVLGIHGGVTLNQHDASACLVEDGRIIFAAEEERYRRNKGSHGCLPVYAIRAALNYSGLNLADIDIIVTPGITYNNICKRSEQWLAHYFGCVPKVEAIHHQEAHLYSLLALEPELESCLLSSDAYGDGLSGMYGIMNKEGKIEIKNTRNPSESLGRMYALLTSYFGYKPGEDEYKIMGLSAMGNPNKYNFDEFFTTNSDGDEVLNEKVFQSWNPTQDEPFYTAQARLYTTSPRRMPWSNFSLESADMAASIQKLYEKHLTKLLNNMCSELKNRKVYMAGGTALNSLANYRLKKHGIVDDIIIQPAASDRGLSMGCAVYGSKVYNDTVPKLTNLSLGTSYSPGYIESELQKFGIKYSHSKNIQASIASMIKHGKVIGLLQGRSEFGPRALGNRSILASPVIKEMKNILNMKIKFRESFRPFAAMCLEEDISLYFKNCRKSPYMTELFDALPHMHNEMPSIVHCDGTCRIQTVTEEENPYIYSILSSLKLTQHPAVVINTSFNLSGEPIVETPADAIRSFFSSGLDCLILEKFIVIK